MTQHKILYCWFKKGSTTARKYIEEGIINGFLAAGHEVETWDGVHTQSLEKILNDFQPDVFLGHVRNQPGYNPALWITNACFGVLQRYKNTHGLKVALETHPDSITMFNLLDIPMSIVEKNKPFHYQARPGLPAEEKLVNTKFVDLILHAFTDKVNNYGFRWWVERVPVMSWPLAADSTVYVESQDDVEQDIDISFVGGWWPSKGLQLDKYMKPMMEEFGDRLHIYGTGWPYGSRGYLPDNEVGHIFASSKINISLHELPFVQHHPTHVSERVFKVGMVGGFAISDNNPCILEYFDISREVIISHSPEDMIESCNYYLKYESERKEIANNFRERVKTDHTYIHRVNSLLERLF